MFNKKKRVASVPLFVFLTLSSFEESLDGFRIGGTNLPTFLTINGLRGGEAKPEVAKVRLACTRYIRPSVVSGKVIGREPLTSSVQST